MSEKHTTISLTHPRRLVDGQHRLATLLDRRPHVPDSVADDEVDQYLTWYPIEDA